jgi:F0F1-type ATP synthase epsilon subunit
MASTLVGPTDRISLEGNELDKSARYLQYQAAVGHQGDMPDHASLMVAVPDWTVSIAVLLADGNKNVKTVAAELLTAVQQALG